MEILKLKTFIQLGETRIVLRKLEIPGFPSCACERLVGGRVQQGSYGCENESAEGIMVAWEKFEHSIHSKEV